MVIIKWICLTCCWYLLSLTALIDLTIYSLTRPATAISRFHTEQGRTLLQDTIPKPSGYVNDFEKIYSTRQKAALEGILSDFEKKTGIKIYLVTIDTTMTVSDGVDGLTLKFLENWSEGRKEKNNTVTIGISRAYRKMRIQNASGVQNIITDTETKEIIDTNFIPEFRKNSFYEGTLKGLESFQSRLLKNLNQGIRVSN